MMSKAVDAARLLDYDEAILLLRRASQASDYRFAELTTNAKNAIAKIESLRDRALKMAADAKCQAQAAFDRGDQAEAARLLQTVPASFLDDDALKLLGETKSFTNQLSALQSEVSIAIAEKRWNAVGSLLNQLIDLSPTDPQYLRLASQVASKLIAQAKQRLSRGEYEEAA
ncbi:MAG: hypothetical protein AB8B91_17985, partial [Rubripirellula sp.]